MKRKEIIKVLALSVSIVVVMVSFARCQGIGGFSGFNGTQANVNPYFITGDQGDQEVLRELFALLPLEAGNSRGQLAIVREIAAIYLRQGEFGRLVNFLNGRVHQYPDDPFNAYYLFMIAFAHQQKDALPIAALYFDMIVKNYPDLEVQGRSIHLASLNQLVTLVTDPRQRVWYYEELVSRFLDQIDPALTFFMLGQAYESIGEWDNAIRAYTRFLANSRPGFAVPGFPDAYSYARRMVDFSNSARNWTFESLDALAGAVRSALGASASGRLMRYQARANFFTRTWESEDSAIGATAGHATFNLAGFMQRSQIRYANTLEVSSNGNEAFLRTWGWALHLPTWYFYFRRIHFPPDPEMHGRWEWAGIFYGERF
ncbi:MAG: tetratricopeptide repeat-containing protein [Treponema sp.]|nr:tetratricopeptide repeat-containing protein [Treponema sp.]